MIYINSIASITHQETFDNPGFSSFIKELEKGSELVKPNYKEFIPAKLLRRMSIILRNGVAASSRALNGQEPGAIIFGTGLGCLTDTEKFLDTSLTVTGLLPPTSFIQSTHNTIAGQVSLSLGSQAYNTTYTQNSISFENALLDGVIHVEEGHQNVLVGAADEATPYVQNAVEQMIPGGLNLTSGVTALTLGSEKTEHNQSELIDVQVYHQDVSDVLINSFLESHNITLEETEVYISNSFLGNNKVSVNGKDVNSFAGVYTSNSAFGLHWAIDELKQSSKKFSLIVNAMTPGNLGLTLIKSIDEA